MTVGRIYNEVAALTGFSYEKMYGHFNLPGKNLVVVITRWPYYNKVAVRWGFHCINKVYS